MITEGQDDGRFARRAVLRLSGIELWERYSFYNMFGLLPLFVAAPVSKGGLGWSGGDALRFFGVYLFSVSVAPLVGGWLTERWLGGRIALRTGTVLLLIGHGLLALAAIIPAWSAWAAAEAMRAAVIAGGGGLAQLAVPVGLPGDQGTAYTAVTCCFYGAIAFVAAGNGLFKPILSVVIGRLPHASPGERESAFTLFFLFVNIGGLFSLVIGGWLQEVAGWSAAFTAAAAGMAIAFVVTVVLEPHYIRPFVARPAPAHDLPPAEPGQRVGWRVPMLLLVVFSTVAAVLSLQSYGFVNLFIDRSVARGIGRFTIPSTWFVALNPVIIMLVTPVLVRGWRRGKLGAKWSTTERFALGFGAMGISYGLMYAASLEARTSMAVDPALVLGAIATIAIGELFITPAGVAATTRIVPRRLQTVAVGGLTAAIGVGGWLSGRVGALALETDDGAVLLALAGLSLFTGALLLFCRALLRRQGI